MNPDDALRDLDGQLRNAVTFFWTTRVAQGERQGEDTGDRDRGGRAAVTGGGHCGEFVRLTRNLLVGSGIPDARVFTRRRTTDLPGYFRAAKDWDLVAVVDGTLLAVVELKSPVRDPVQAPCARATLRRSLPHHVVARDWSKRRLPGAGPSAVIPVVRHVTRRPRDSVRKASRLDFLSHVY